MPFRDLSQNTPGLSMRQRKIQPFRIHHLLIHPVDIHRTLPFLIHCFDVCQGEERLLFRHKLAAHILAQVEVHFQCRAGFGLLHHIDIPQKEMLWLVVQLQRRTLHLHVGDRHEGGSIAGGDLNASQRVGKLAVVHADSIELKVLRDGEIIPFDYAVANQHAGAIHHINIIYDEIITPINSHRGVINSRFFTELRGDVFGLDVSDDKMLTVFHMHQLATVAADDVRHYEIFYRLMLRIVVVVGTPGQTDADPPVDFAIGAVDVVDNVVGDKDIMVVDRHVPLYRIPLQVAEVAVGDARPIHLVMESLAQNGVVGLADANVVDEEVTHHPWLFSADVDLGDRPVAAHRQPLDHAVGAAHVEGDILHPPCPFPHHFTAILQHKASTPVAGQRAADEQRFARRNKDSGIDVFTGQVGGHHHRIAFGKSLFKGGDPVAIVILADVNRAARRTSQPGIQQRRGRQQGKGGDKGASGNLF